VVFVVAGPPAPPPAVLLDLARQLDRLVERHGGGLAAQQQAHRADLGALEDEVAGDLAAAVQREVDAVAGAHAGGPLAGVDVDEAAAAGKRVEAGAARKDDVAAAGARGGPAWVRRRGGGQRECWAVAHVSSGIGHADGFGEV